jgi:hypothetical protein
MTAIKVNFKNGESEIVHPRLFNCFRKFRIKEIKNWEKVEVDDKHFKFNIVNCRRSEQPS